MKKNLFKKKNFHFWNSKYNPDSFSDGGKNLNLDKAVKNAQKMQENGASFIDIGGESTRPGADTVKLQRKK